MRTDVKGHRDAAQHPRQDGPTQMFRSTQKGESSSWLVPNFRRSINRRLFNGDAFSTGPSKMSSRRFLAYALLFIVHLITPSGAEFTADFNDWLTQNFGSDVQKTLERKDIPGNAGSMGGKTTRDEQLVNNPVIFVHGVSDYARGRLGHVARHLLGRGHKGSEIYGTTYADGPQGDALRWAQYSMKCAYVKQVRALIVAVRLYTGRAVDVIGYSLGVVVSRKAILGGVCVDTGEYLGQPLTRYVDTYIGVAGPNHGVPGCVLPVLPVCNQITGLYAGTCPNSSKYLQDINAVAGYEGQNRYTIFSKSDITVGYKVCGVETGSIAGQTRQFVFERQNHDQILSDTAELQRKLLTNHSDQ
uniref:Lipase n=1 Tax=Plectus sambesii TaxID=2011161 RepID=A0A914XFZ2_9BILA